MSSSNCLITGGAGFIGSHIAGKLLDAGHSVRVLDNLSTGDERNLEDFREHLEFIEGDIRNPDTCRKAMADVEVVFHLAAQASVPRSMADPQGCHDNNVNGTFNILMAAQGAGARRVVFSSSSSVYGDTPVLPKVETVEPLPKSPYAAAKLSGEQYVAAFARAGIVEGVALRYFNIFGPRQSPDSAYAAVIPVFMAAALSGGKAPLYGDGGQTRDFTYVDNAVSANLLAAFGPTDRVNGQVCNVGAGDRTSLLRLVELIGEVSGKPLAIEYLPERPGDVRDSLAGMARAESALGYKVLVPIRDGLRNTWEWFQSERTALAL